MVSLAVHEVEIMALIGNLAANISRAIENGAAREPAAAKPMLQAAAARMHALASALPDAAPAPPAAPDQPDQGESAAAPAPAPASSTESNPAAAQPINTGTPKTHTSA